MDRDEGQSLLSNNTRLYSSVVIALALMLTLTSIACSGEQTTNARSEKGGVRKVPMNSDTTLPSASGDSAVRASASVGAVGDARHLNCRAQTYIVKEGLNNAETKDFVARITNRVLANLDGSGNKDMGEILDNIGVPSYKGFCG
jgi:hypothetical protein